MKIVSPMRIADQLRVLCHVYIPLHDYDRYRFRWLVFELEAGKFLGGIMGKLTFLTRHHLQAPPLGARPPPRFGQF